MILKDVLVLDDEPVALTLIEKMLSNKYNVIAFDNVESAIDSIRERPYEAIISDIKMPMKTGFDFLNEVKKVNQFLPVILMTANNTKETTLKALREGAYDCFEKPFKKNDLVKRVDEAVRVHENKRKLEVSQKELLSVHKYKSKLLNVLCHDLSNHILLTQTSLLCLKKKYPELEHDEEMLFLQKTIKEEVGILEEIKVRESKNFKSLQTTNVSESVNSILNLYTKVLKKKNITVSLKLADVGDIQCNPYLFRTSILGNILNNCIKYTPVGGQISITSEIKEESLKIIIEDSGVGIPDETIKNLNEDRHIESVNGLEGEAGTGLGLFLVKNLLIDFNAKLVIENKVNENKEGSRFTLEFNL